MSTIILSFLRQHVYMHIHRKRARLFQLLLKKKKKKKNKSRDIYRVKRNDKSKLPSYTQESRMGGRIRAGTGTGNGDCVRCIPHNYFRLLDLSDISSVAAADSLQLLLLVTLAKLGTRVKFCSCREVLEGSEKGRGRKGGCWRREKRSRSRRYGRVTGRGPSERARTSLGLHRWGETA